MSWQIQSVIHTGGREQQQDRTRILSGRHGREYLLVLGDGMGGHAHGAVAAQTLVDTAERCFPPPRNQEIPEFLRSLCLEAHRAIRAIPWEGEEGRPGSTCVLLYLRRDQAHWLHLGDSRLYYYQGEELLFQTEDHTLAALKASRENEELAKTITASDHRLYRCLGGNQDPKPVLGSSRVEEDQWFLLCSDGFWHGIPPQEAAAIVKGQADLFLAAQQLVELAVSRAGENSDNVSVILARKEANPSPLERLRALWHP